MPFDKSKFLDQFKSEARERMQALNHGLLKLEKNLSDKNLLEAMMREAHTIKGSSAMMGYKRISRIAHKMEDALSNALKGELALSKEHFDMLYKCLDSIEPLLEYRLAGDEDSVSTIDVDGLCAEADALFLHNKTAPQQKPQAQPETKTQQVSPAPYVKRTIQEESIRVSTEKLDRLMDLSGELLISKIRLKELARVLAQKVDSQPELRIPLGQQAKDLEKVSEIINLSSSSIQEEIMRARMVPIANLFGVFPRAMRDLALEKNKDIEVVINGGETQIDKAIIDEMKDPIMHILRNSIDHGIEDRQERQDLGKPKTAALVLSASAQGSSVIIEIKDDGRGIDAEAVKEAALKKGLITAERAQEMGREQLFHLLFLPGFSTSREVTDISGRGVGLDVVREKVLSLKGTVDILSNPGKGTSVIIKLPLTLAITDTLIAEAGGSVYAIPIESVVETLRIGPESIKTVEGKEAISAREHILPLVRLKELFGLPEKGITEKKFFPVIIVQAAENRIGLLADQLHGHQEIVRKPLGDPLLKVRDIAGATILGDGRVILILDIASIIASSQGLVVKRPKREDHPAESAAKKHKTVLLAEDALSTAMLEKNVLESSGFSAVIARDGQEALEKASQEKFDLVITDVLMPRMDGFELTGRLKKDPLYKEVPIIIVTTRETDEDKRRGLEAGADAYILKSEFTSEGLLETIERLIG